jgi:hypothetical protein
MKRLLLVAALVTTAGLAAIDMAPTLAGLADTEKAHASFEADLCEDRSCQVVHASGLDDHDCNADEWHFAITQVDPDTAPRSIHVTWAEDDASVGLERVTGKTAHYRTSSHLEQPVENATTRITEDWDGTFRLGEGPCRP